MNKMVDPVTKQYELTSSRDVIYDIISSNISDPLTGQQARSSATHWIFDGFPNPADLGKSAPAGWKFPIIIFDYPEVETENKVLDGSKQRISSTFSIEVYSRDRSEASSLAEECKHILETSQQSELRKATLFGPNLLSTSMETDFIGGNKFYSVIMEFEFMRFD